MDNLLKETGFITDEEDTHPCPICNHEFYNLDHSQSVCDYHLDTFIVTKCKECGKACFSKSPGFCPEHDDRFDYLYY